MELRELLILGRDALVVLRELFAVLAADLRLSASLRRVDSAHAFVSTRLVARFLRFCPVVLSDRAMLVRGVRHLDHELLDVVVLREPDGRNSEQRSEQSW